MEKTNIRAYTLQELANVLVQHGEKAFRAKQIWQWLWQKGVTRFEDMTNLSKDFREFTRNLLPEEIFDQVVAVKRLGEERGLPLSNIVLMGMGEPLLNYENVLAAIERITAEDGLGMSPYRLTLSTSGIVEGIKRLADDDVRFNLAISLHSAVNTTRDKIMPINKAYPLTKLAEAIRYFVDKTGTRPTFEYLLLKGVNDSLDDAKALALFCRQFPVKINIIEYNEVDNAPYRHSPDASRDQFVRYLESKNIVVNVRRSKGKDIDAACGQLANKNS